jgi:hypothetical protein
LETIETVKKCTTFKNVQLFLIFQIDPDLDLRCLSEEMLQSNHLLWEDQLVAAVFALKSKLPDERLKRECAAILEKGGSILCI